MKILFILSRFPYPLEKGDKLRAFQHLKLLAAKHEVHLAAISDGPVSEDSLQAVKPYCKSITIIRNRFPQLLLNLLMGFLRKLPLQVAYFYSKIADRKINRLAEQIDPDVIYCQLIRTALYGKHLKAKRKVIDFQDAFTAGTQQRFEKASWLLKPIYRRELRKVAAFEQDTYNWFDKHIIISESDRQQLAIKDKSNILILPNGVDFDYYHADRLPAEHDILFVGNMQYPPNIDAATFLIREIMPLVWNKIPGANVTLCGAEPVAAVRALAAKNVKVTGWVPDVRAYYRSARVFIAPMRIGTGLQNKLLEAMATGLPCITTSISATPLGGTAGRDFLVGNDKVQLAEHLIRLIQDENLSKEIGNNGLLLVRHGFSMQAAGTGLLKVIE